ncbi:peptidylprolyl isomerase [Cohnella suwonensis]|uniref:peptidylprolyl isomerase n=1 Tax=Cohnella suwonensis TaxID=696072 RepID=A0ABW0LXK1_9BACL
MARAKNRYRVYGFALVAAVLLIAAAFLTMAAFANGKPALGGVALQVNGEPVETEEWRQAVLRHRAAVYAELQPLSSQTDPTKFWRTKIGEETPLERLHRVALEELVRIKVQQQLAKREGLLADSTYAVFLKDLEKENQRREKAVEKGEVIFGPLRYDEVSYYDMKQGELTASLQEKLYPASDASDERIAAYYEENKESRFKRTPEVALRQLIFPFAEGGMTREAAAEWAERVREALKAGEDWEAVRQKLVSRDEVTFDTETMVLNERFMREEGMRWQKLIGAGLPLKTGEISEAFEENGAYRVLICTGIEPQGYYPLAEVKDGIRSEWSRNQYERLVDRLTNEAEIEIVRKTFDRVDGT